MSGSGIPNVGGVYTDPNHAPTKASANLYELKDPWFGGLRILGRTTSDSTDFSCIGCDDGIHWWTLTAKFTQTETGTDGVAKVSMDFTPKAPGVGLLQCGFEEPKGSLHFYEDDGTTIGNTWSRLTPAPEFDLQVQMKHAAFNDPNGLYVDPEIFKAGSNSFAGIRVISDRLGKFVRDEIVVIGTDDGTEWWALHGGSFQDKRRGEISIGKDTNAKITQGGTLTLTWKEKETKWIKMTPKMDIHKLPKQN